MILGSLPGEISLARRQYYAHPRNQFWRLVGDVIGQPELPALTYEDRLSTLLEAGIGLWDTVRSAERVGSLDASIRNARHAPLREVVSRLPQLRLVAFNGRKAAGIGRRELADATLRLIDLPSSSPAYAAMPFTRKLEQWNALRDCLDRSRPRPC